MGGKQHQRKLVEVIVVLDLSEGSHHSLTEDVAQRLWAKAVENHSSITGEPERLESVAVVVLERVRATMALNSAAGEPDIAPGDEGTLREGMITWDKVPHRKWGVGVLGLREGVHYIKL